MLFHASKIPDLTILKPQISNHGKPLVYFSQKRQNVLVYLSNAIEKHCKSIGFQHIGKYKTWGSYGFTENGILRLEEYYPNATVDTYKGESGYIYSVEYIKNYCIQEDIPYAITSENEVAVAGCEYVPDAYEAILEAIGNGEIVLQKYEDNNQDMLDWIEKTIKTEYNSAVLQPEYREFLKSKFEWFNF
ncbi:MAG: hypothetical protein FWD34_02555 [Oscillospiraceae bacterium]|nr:hypothetical protein [Oscillospiraceae bacterium]